MKSSPLWHYFLLPLFILSVHAQDLDHMVAELGKAVREKRDRDASAICDRILSRDVVTDFLVDGPEASEAAFRFLLDRGGNFGERMEEWKQQLESDPGSERLNFLLAMGAAYIRGSSIESYGRPGNPVPVKMKLKREGATFSAYMWNARGRWEQIESKTMALPRAVLVGIFGSLGNARFQDTKLFVEGTLFTEVNWEGRQISRPSTSGNLIAEGQSLVLSGRGWPLFGREDLFFASREVEGDFEFETILESMDPRTLRFETGLMVRASIDPGSAFISVGSQENSVKVCLRSVPEEGAKYLTALCAQRPTDPAFVSVWLRKMMSRFMNEEARLAADRLLASKPETARLDDELFAEIYLRSGLESPLLQAKLDQPSGGAERAAGLLEQARKFQDSGENERAVESWRQARELLPDQTLPLTVHRQLIVSLARLERDDEVRKELKRLFLGDAASSSGTPSQMMLDSLQVHVPGLAPTFMPAFYAAAEYGVALEIAGQLEKSGGSSEQKGAARAVALTLQVAAKDPSTMFRLKAGASRDPLPIRGLALLAFQLQQTAEGRPAAAELLTLLLQKQGSDGRGLDPVAVLAWRTRIHEMLGDQVGMAQDRADLVAAWDQKKLLDNSVVAPVIGRLLEAGDLSQAQKLVARLARPSVQSPFDPESDVAVLLDLYQSKGMPMPIVWTVPEGDEVRIRWEFAPNNWGYHPMREVRPRGSGIAAQNERYSLAIYAQRGQHFGMDFLEEDLLVRLPAVESEGSWKGQLPPDRPWVAAVLRNEQNGKERSPSVPANVGTNLLSPFDGAKLEAKTGAWTTPVKWYWTAPLSASFPPNSWLISRLQADLGAIEIDHRPVAVNPNRAYVFSGWLKTDDASGEAHLGLLFLDREGKQLGHFGESTTIGGRWTLVSAHLGPKNTGGMVRIPPNTASIQPHVKISTQCEVGDVGLYEVGDIGFFEVGSPNK